MIVQEPASDHHRQDEDDEDDNDTLVCAVHAACTASFKATRDDDVGVLILALLRDFASVQLNFIDCVPAIAARVLRSGDTQ